MGRNKSFARSLSRPDCNGNANGNLLSSAGVLAYKCDDAIFYSGADFLPVRFARRLMNWDRRLCNAGPGRALQNGPRLI